MLKDGPATTQDVMHPAEVICLKRDMGRQHTQFSDGCGKLVQVGTLVGELAVIVDDVPDILGGILQSLVQALDDSTACAGRENQGMCQCPAGDTKTDFLYAVDGHIKENRQGDL